MLLLNLNEAGRPGMSNLWKQKKVRLRIRPVCQPVSLKEYAKIADTVTFVSACLNLQTWLHNAEAPVWICAPLEAMDSPMLLSALVCTSSFARKWAHLSQLSLLTIQGFTSRSDWVLRLPTWLCSAPLSCIPCFQRK